ncbi:SHOCT domain-containing protein [Planomonospora parontospora]|uniref:SHOCT domain-containing protein n=2 Tax=Planomonospora parontospora TaxID=58119 RepID=UPI0019450D9A|nr:SHOCT domain-containing protein [Planomonospora parontospora]
MNSMHGYGHGAMMWPMGGMMLLWLALTALVVWLVVRSTPSRAGSGLATPPADTDAAGPARRILAERYARGELDTDEYTQRLAALR